MRTYSLLAADGVRLRGYRVGVGPTAVVFCHGFLGSSRKPRLVRFQRALAAACTVYAVDLRGHGASGGRSTFGALEYLDVDAVVRRARDEGFERVITFGGSMGGIAVIRQAALLGGVDGVIAVSTPSRWTGHETSAVRRMIWLTSSSPGRLVLRSLGCRVTRAWEPCEDPVDVVGRIAPAPTVLVHGRDDHFFPVEQALELYSRAREPRRLLLASRFGHAEDGYTPAFAERIVATIGAMPRVGWPVAVSEEARA